MFSTSKFLEFDGTNDFHATQSPHVGIFWMTKHEQNSFLGFLGISWDFLGFLGDLHLPVVGGFEV